VVIAAYDGAIAYLTGRMSDAPARHTDLAAKGPAIAEMLFVIEGARALFHRAISEAQVDPPLEAVQRAVVANALRCAFRFRRRSLIACCAAR
jgi:hypothetical protein